MSKFHFLEMFKKLSLTFFVKMKFPFFQFSKFSIFSNSGFEIHLGHRPLDTTVFLGTAATSFDRRPNRTKNLTTLDFFWPKSFFLPKAVFPFPPSRAVFLFLVFFDLLRATVFEFDLRGGLRRENGDIARKLENRAAAEGAAKDSNGPKIDGLF